MKVGLPLNHCPQLPPFLSSLDLKEFTSPVAFHNNLIYFFAPIFQDYSVSETFGLGICEKPLKFSLVFSKLLCSALRKQAKQ